MNPTNSCNRIRVLMWLYVDIVMDPIYVESIRTTIVNEDEEAFE